MAKSSKVQDRIPCPHCGKPFAKSYMSRHLKSCPATTNSIQKPLLPRDQKSSSMQGNKNQQQFQASTGKMDSFSTISMKINEILKYMKGQDERIQHIETRISVLERGGNPSPITKIGKSDLLSMIRHAFYSIDQKVSNKVPVAEIIKYIRKETNLTDDSIYQQLVDLFYDDKIELQLGKTLDDSAAADPSKKFTWLGLK